MDTNLIRDSFLDNYDWFRTYCDGLDYDVVTNPTDGVDYHGISLEIPEFMKIDVLYKLQQLVGPITRYNMFLRQSVDGSKAPHGAHNDLSMGQHTMILYLNRPEHCKGGTSLVSHKEHGMSESVTEEQIEIWERDTNNYDAWEIDEMCDMKSNRAFICPAGRMHRAEDGHFGDNNEDGRLVMVCFFDVC